MMGHLLGGRCCPATSRLGYKLSTICRSWSVRRSVHHPCTAFYSGNLGPHTYQVTSDKAWVNVAGNGTGAVTLSGTAPLSADTTTLTVACTNVLGQTTTITHTATASADLAATRNNIGCGAGLIGLGPLDVAHKASWIACKQLTGGYVLRDDRASSNDRAIADGNAFQDHGPHPYPNVIADFYR